MTDWLKQAAEWDEIARTHRSARVRQDAKDHAEFCRKMAQREGQSNDAA